MKNLRGFWILYRVSSKKDGNTNEYLNIIEQTISWRYVINIKIIVNEEFTIERLAIVVIGADKNIIHKGLIPTIYYEKFKPYPQHTIKS